MRFTWFSTCLSPVRLSLNLRTSSVLRCPNYVCSHVHLFHGSGNRSPVDAYRHKGCPQHKEADPKQCNGRQRPTHGSARRARSRKNTCLTDASGSVSHGARTGTASHHLPGLSKALLNFLCLTRQKSSRSSSARAFRSLLQMDSDCLVAQTLDTSIGDFSGDHGEYDGFVVMVDVRRTGDALASHNSGRTQRPTNAGAAQLSKPQLGNHDSFEASVQEQSSSLELIQALPGALDVRKQM